MSRTDQVVQRQSVDLNTEFAEGAEKKERKRQRGICGLAELVAEIGRSGAAPLQRQGALAFWFGSVT
jgi:hypothetical protein